MSATYFSSISLVLAKLSKFDIVRKIRSLWIKVLWFKSGRFVDYIKCLGLSCFALSICKKKLTLGNYNYFYHMHFKRYLTLFFKTDY